MHEQMQRNEKLGNDLLIIYKIKQKTEKNFHINNSGIEFTN